MKTQIRRTLGGEVCHNKRFPKDTIILRLEDGTEYFCSDFRMRQGKITVYIYIPGSRLEKTEIRNKYTKAMYDYAQQFKKKETKRLNYKQMMAHNRKRKNGSGGTRLRKWCGQVTDYECTKNPLHDFRRVYC